MTLLTIAIGCQTLCTFTATFLNSILLYLVLFHTKCNMGFYKYLLAGYAVFEMLFAVAVFIGMPLHLVSEKAWMAFSYTGIFSGTQLAKMGPALFCWFYEVWLGYVIVNFTYRYLAVCRTTVVDKIKRSALLKTLIAIVIFAFLILCTLCSFVFCTQPVIHPNVVHKLEDMYGISDMNSVGYIIVRFQDNDGHAEMSGILGASTHYIIILASTLSVFFFSYSIWKGIKKLQHQMKEVDVKLEKQLFKVLLIQTIVPVVMCHMPSLLNLTFPLWSGDVDLGPLTPFFSVSTTLQKSIDPVIAMIFIGDYRKAILRHVCCRRRVDDSSSAYRNSDPMKSISQQHNSHSLATNVL